METTIAVWIKTTSFLPKSPYQVKYFKVVDMIIDSSREILLLVNLCTELQNFRAGNNFNLAKRQVFDDFLPVLGLEEGSKNPLRRLLQ